MKNLGLSKEGLEIMNGCLFRESDMKSLVQLQTQTVAELRDLNKEHRNVMRWLLITVCVLAIGKALPEVRDVIFGDHKKLEAKTDVGR